MQYSLGNMLKGGGALNPDGLALDLAFALDRSFTTDPAAAGNALITSRRGPAAKFSRGSGATQVNAAGLIEYAPENLAFPSDMSSPWSASRLTATPATGSPLGTYQILTIIDPTGSARLFRTIVVPSSQPYTISVFAKAGTVSTFAFRALTDASSSALFNLLDGTTSGSGASGWSGQAQIIPYPDGWYRCSMTYTPTALSQNYCVDLGLAVLGGTIDFTGFQVERASTASTYYPTTTSAFYGPRFDHDPATGVCKGLLIEEPRTNLATYSADIVSGIGWFTNGVVTAASGTGADGNTSYLITESATDSTHFVSNTGGTTATGATSIVSGTNYTGSIFVKKGAGSADWVQITLGSGGFGTSQYANFNIGSGTVGNSAGLASGIPPRIEEFPNGWYRCIITVTANATVANSVGVILSLIGNTDGTTRLPTYLGNASNSALSSLCQLEAGAFPTSYIPTTSGTAIRSADVCGPMLLGESFINQVEGTLVIELTREPIGSTSIFRAPLRVWASGATNDYAGIDFNDSAIRAPLRTNNTTKYQNNVTDTVFSGRKIAAAWQSGSSALVIDGVVRTTNTVTFSFPTPLDTLGFAQIFNAVYNGRIARIQYFRKRLPDAKLQTLTAP